MAVRWLLFVVMVLCCLLSMVYLLRLMFMLWVAVYLFFIDLAADAAEGFGGDAEVGGDHLLWDAEGELGVLVEEAEISFFGGEADEALNSVLAEDEASVENSLDEFVEGRDLAAEGVEVFFGDEDDFCVFECVDVLFGGGVVEEAFAVACPPVFYCKVVDAFGAFVVDAVGAEAAFTDEDVVAPDVAFLEEVLFFAEFFFDTDGADLFESFVCDGDFAGDILFKDVEHGVKFS